MCSGCPKNAQKSGVGVWNVKILQKMGSGVKKNIFFLFGRKVTWDAQNVFWVPQNARKSRVGSQLPFNPPFPFNPPSTPSRIDQAQNLGLCP